MYLYVYLYHSGTHDQYFTDLLSEYTLARKIAYLLPLQTAVFPQMQDITFNKQPPLREPHKTRVIMSEDQFVASHQPPLTRSHQSLHTNPAYVISCQITTVPLSYPQSSHYHI